MRKRKILPFLGNIIICNIISLVINLLLTGVLNIVTEGKISMFSRTDERWGYSRADLSGAALIIIPILIVLVSIATYFSFYCFSYITLKRNSNTKEVFLKEIGFTPLSRDEIRNEYMRKSGNYYVVVFLIFISIIMFLDLLKVPFLSAIIMPLYILYLNILSLFGVGANSRILLTLLTIIGNGVLYYLYHRIAVARLYNKWAQERMHIEES